jgi:cytochrome P450
MRDITVPKGTIAMIVPAVTYYTELIWGPTASRFDPDRYNNLPKAVQDPYISQVFLVGPRICIGKAFALLEFKTIMVELIKNFILSALITSRSSE